MRSVEIVKPLIEPLRSAEWAAQFGLALGLDRRMAAVRETLSIGLAALDALDFAAVVLDREGFVVFANLAAELLERRGSIRMSLQRLTIGSRRDAGALDSLLANVAAEGMGGSFKIDSRQGAVELLALVTPLASREPVEDDEGPLTLVTMRAAYSQPLWHTPMLRDMFGLSEAEGRIALGLVGGRSLEELAVERGTAIPTLRTQLRSLFRKVGVGSQQDLIRVLSALPQVRSSAARRPGWMV